MIGWQGISHSGHRRYRAVVNFVTVDWSPSCRQGQGTVHYRSVRLLLHQNLSVRNTTTVAFQQTYLATGLMGTAFSLGTASSFLLFCYTCRCI